MFALELHEDYQDLISPHGQPAVDWDAASCRDGTGSMTHLFFSDEIPEIIEAKRVCSTCPVAGPCLDGALERREAWGVWGGELFVNGRILAEKRKRGRPPKNPVPGLSLTA
jgi:WhiB family transcriptional regulator, redox-sensing transcriptional regulator